VSITEYPFDTGSAHKVGLACQIPSFLSGVAPPWLAAWLGWGLLLMWSKRPVSKGVSKGVELHPCYNKESGGWCVLTATSFVLHKSGAER